MNAAIVELTNICTPTTHRYDHSPQDASKSSENPSLSLLLNILPDGVCTRITSRADKIAVTPERVFLPEMA
jgi:hypothetical protein